LKKNEKKKYHDVNSKKPTCTIAWGRTQDRKISGPRGSGWKKEKMEFGMEVEE
jgi:hypothetical protein